MFSWHGRHGHDQQQESASLAFVMLLIQFLPSFTKLQSKLVNGRSQELCWAVHSLHRHGVPRCGTCDPRGGPEFVVSGRSRSCTRQSEWPGKNEYSGYGSYRSHHFEIPLHQRFQGLLLSYLCGVRYIRVALKLPSKKLSIYIYI